MNKRTSFNEAQYGAMRTAFLTAYPKIFTNIEYSIDIFSNMKELACKEGFSFQPSLFNNEMSIEIEARYKALSKALSKKNNNNTLVIEIASGLSPRRLEFKDYNYIEVDFKPVMDVKRNLYKLMGYEDLLGSLYDVDLSKISELHSFLSKITKNKKYEQIIIVNEGLFWYLTKEEISAMTTEIYNSLKDFNWLWITADCPPTDNCDDDYRKVISASAKAKRGTFTDYNDFTEFFKLLGLNNTRHKLSKLIKFKDISSAKFFSLQEDDTLKRINSYTDISILKRK